MGSSGGSGGTSGNGGSISVGIQDAAGSGTKSGDASASSIDAGLSATIPSNLSMDAPAFNWDTHACVGCGGSTSTSGSGGASGSGGSSGMAGSSGAGGSAPDAAIAPGADAALSADGPVLGSDAGASDVASTDAVRIADAATPSDAGASPDASVRCVASIQAVNPVTDALPLFPLVAGANVQIVLRAAIVSGAANSTSAWTWQASRDGAPVAIAAVGSQDPAAAAFPIANAGTYTFTASDGRNPGCVATIQANAVAANACAPCDSSVILRAAPPSSVEVPIQSGAIGLSGSAPFSQTNIILSRGVAVKISPSVGTSLIPSYVRIDNQAGDLVVDGLADPKAGFATRLLALNNLRAMLRYNVLVVPIDGGNGGTIAATAPQLYANLTPATIAATSFSLAGGLKVTGTITDANGQVVAGARVMLSNQDPAATASASQLLFSSVGQSDAQGSYLLYAQPGTYWVSFSPPSSSGLSEAVTGSAITLNAAATVDYQWSAPTTVSPTFSVLDASGAPAADGATVRLTSAQANAVGTMTFAPLGGLSSTWDARGSVRAQGTTSGGQVSFANLPSGVTYDVLVVPGALGAFAATTQTQVTLLADGASQTLVMQAQGHIAGKLLSSQTGIDWTRVNVAAYDRSDDTPESPHAVAVNADGSFSVGVSPARPYVVMVMPDTSLGLARTFVGPGPLHASEFAITQKVLSSMAWSAVVMDEYQTVLSETALQVFCDAGWPGCVDATLPLAETTSGAGGSFLLTLPDPSTR